jgi:hypothetical protein
MKRYIVVIAVIVFCLSALTAEAKRDCSPEAASFMMQGGINSQVFKKADLYMRQHYPDYTSSKHNRWVASSDGFHKYWQKTNEGKWRGDNLLLMQLYWDGSFEVRHASNLTILSTGEWTNWLK